VQGRDPLNKLLMYGHGDPAQINAELQTVLVRENELKAIRASYGSPSVISRDGWKP
jgi:hypothetical protein